MPLLLAEVGDKDQCGNANSQQWFFEPPTGRGKLRQVQSQAHIPLKMIREDLQDIPEFGLPSGYTLRWYRPGDEAHWLNIHLDADHENQFSEETFGRQFGSAASVLAQRQCYLLAPNEDVIGTATAWFKDDFEGERIGRVHWVAIVPEYQGRGLSKPLMAGICRRLRDLGHSRAYLTTSAARTAAIHLYLRFGFTPLIRTEHERKVWAHVPPSLRY